MFCFLSYYSTIINTKVKGTVKTSKIIKITGLSKFEFEIFFRLSGLSPFMGDTDLETMANVTIAEYDYEDEAFNNISSDAKNFIDKLLVKEKE